MKPVIGVISLYDDEKNSYWMLPGYVKALEKCNAVPLILPLTSDLEELEYFLKICDGFLLTGGHDVDPEIYGEQAGSKCGTICKERDLMECSLLEKAVKLNKSILGICRGIQLMNAYFGGTLYQDLEDETHTKLEHHMKPPYDRDVHNVTIERDTPLYDILDKDVYGVNSYHHQGVKKVSPKFKVMAKAEDGLVEGIYMPDRKFVMGIQWHPEFRYLTDEDSMKIFVAFTASCRV